MEGLHVDSGVRDQGTHDDADRIQGGECDQAGDQQTDRRSARLAALARWSVKGTRGCCPASDMKSWLPPHRAAQVVASDLIPPRGRGFAAMGA